MRGKTIKLFFMKILDGDCKLSKGQAVILLGLGLQLKDIDDVTQEMDIPVNQALALFNKSVKRIAKYIRMIYETEVRDQVDQEEKGKSMINMEH